MGPGRLGGGCRFSDVQVSNGNTFQVPLRRWKRLKVTEASRQPWDSLLGTASGGGGPRGWGLLWGEPSKQLVQDDPQGQVTYDLA